jgi:hypothetical protein
LIWKNIVLKALVEFVGYFALKTGKKSFTAALENREATVFDLLKQVEQAFVHSDLTVTEGVSLRPGVLIFYRKINGGTERIFDMNTILEEVNGHIIISTLMGGG